MRILEFSRREELAVGALADTIATDRRWRRGSFASSSLRCPAYRTPSQHSTKRSPSSARESNEPRIRVTRSAFIIVERTSTVGQVERSDTCRFIRPIDGRQVSYLDLPYGLASSS